MRLTRFLLAAVTALLLASGARTALAAEDPAAEPVGKLYAKVDEALKSGTTDLKGRVAIVGPTFAEVFDLPAMVQLAAGPKWKTLKPDQQSAVTDAFKTYFITLYANRLTQAAGGKFEIKPGSEERAGNKVVHSKVTTKEGEDSDVDYVVNAGNKIQDVLLNGSVSEIAALRGSFAEPLKKGGADELVKFLRGRTDGMLAAKPPKP